MLLYVVATSSVLGFLPQVEIARATLHKSRQLRTKRPLPVLPERELRGISPISRAGPPVLSVNESAPMHMLVCGTATSGSIPQWHGHQRVHPAEASAPHMLRIVPLTVFRVGRSYEYFSSGFELHSPKPLKKTSGLETCLSHGGPVVQGYVS